MFKYWAKVPRERAGSRFTAELAAAVDRAHATGLVVEENHVGFELTFNVASNDEDAALAVGEAVVSSVAGRGFEQAVSLVRPGPA